MLRQRAVSSVVIVALTLGAAFLGRAIFAVFVAVVLGLALRETYAMFRHAGHRTLRAVGYVLVAAVPAVALARRWDAWGAALIAAALFVPLLALIFREDYRGALTDWAMTVVGALYVALPAAHFVLLRDLNGPLNSLLGRVDRWGLWQLPDFGEMTRGLGWFLLAQVVTWLSDVGAYAAGRAWGRRKLAPAISPGQT